MGRRRRRRGRQLQGERTRAPRETAQVHKYIISLVLIVVVLLHKSRRGRVYIADTISRNNNSNNNFGHVEKPYRVCDCTTTTQRAK